MPKAVSAACRVLCLQRCEHGISLLEESSAFQPIPDRYELILSFNLLSRSYFTSDAISVGVRNLAASLSEGGLLILGNWESVAAFQKSEGSLIVRFRQGNWESPGVVDILLT